VRKGLDFLVSLGVRVDADSIAWRGCRDVIQTRNRLAHDFIDDRPIGELEHDELWQRVETDGDEQFFTMDWILGALEQVSSAASELEAAYVSWWQRGGRR